MSLPPACLKTNLCAFIIQKRKINSSKRKGQKSKIKRTSGSPRLKTRAMFEMWYVLVWTYSLFEKSERYHVLPSSPLSLCLPHKRFSIINWRPKGSHIRYCQSLFRILTVYHCHQPHERPQPEPLGHQGLPDNPRKRRSEILPRNLTDRLNPSFDRSR